MAGLWLGAVFLGKLHDEKPSLRVNEDRVSLSRIGLIVAASEVTLCERSPTSAADMAAASLSQIDITKASVLRASSIGPTCCQMNRCLGMKLTHFDIFDKA